MRSISRFQTVWLVAAVGSFCHGVLGFQQRDGTTRSSTRFRRSSSALSINLNWFSGSKKKDDSSTDDLKDYVVGVDEFENEKGESSGSSMGGVSGMVDSMENLKRAQRAGKMTSRLVRELSSTNVEGTAADGKVRVTMDCQQRPISVNIDEAYVGDVDVADLCSSVTNAMTDAHAKSLDRMDEKMKSFYAELGLTPGN